MKAETIQQHNANETKLRQFTETIFGTRIINNTVVKHLRQEIYLFYNSLHLKEAYYSDKIETEYSKIMDKMEAKGSRTYTYRECGDICAILYQIKYWYDVKCRTNKKQHTFYKKESQFQNELCWLNPKKIRKHLMLLTDMQIIYRDPTYDEGYIYLLNTKHPIVKLTYMLDATTKFYNKHGKDDETIKIKMLGMKEVDFYQFIDNKAVKHCYNSIILPPTDLADPLGHLGLPPRTTCPTPPTDLAGHTKTTVKTKPKTKQKRSRTSKSAHTPDNKTSQDITDNNLPADTQTVIDSSVSPEKTVVDSILPKLNGDSVLLKSVMSKWEKLSVARKEEIEKLKIATWRRKMKGAYDYSGDAENNPYDKSENWFNDLNEKDKQVVGQFQKEMYPANAKIQKEKSYKISLIDAHTVQDNFLQFCKHKELI